MNRLAWVELRVKDLAGQSQFYRRLLGFEVFEEKTDRVVLGGREPCLLLATGPAATDGSGLYHVAWRLPSSQHLASWWAHLQSMGWPLAGASDHGVSEALYLADPEGNGIEVYADRPHAQWPAEMGTAPLGLQPNKAVPWSAPELGHLHLRTRDIQPATAFFEGLGMSLQQRMPRANFLAWDDYHHHIAINSWGPTSGLGLVGYGLRGPGQPAVLKDPLGHEVHCLGQLDTRVA